ncbi:MAG: MMPL family transporter, partial [Firmicutes bacterium]|nr:MMPL family transporter [Bacillota bacterium]
SRSVLSRWQCQLAWLPPRDAMITSIGPHATLIHQFSSHSPVHTALVRWLHAYTPYVQPLTPQTANNWLARHIAHSLTRTDVYALALAVILLTILFGSPLLALIAAGMAALSTLYAAGFLVIFSTQITLSEYAVNIMNLLTLGLGVDYAVFLIIRFRRAWITERAFSPSSEAAALRAYTATRHGTLSAIALSASVLVSILGGLIFLPRAIGLSLVFSAVIAVACTYGTARWILLPSLRAWPQLTTWGSWPAGSDRLDRWYHTLQAKIRQAPGPIFLLTFSLMLVGLFSLHTPLTLTTPTSAVSLLPSHTPLRYALQRIDPASSPFTAATLVLQPGSATPWPHDLTAAQHLMRSLHTHYPALHISTVPPIKLAASPCKKADRHILLKIAGQRPLPRSALIAFVRHHLP